MWRAYMRSREHHYKPTHALTNAQEVEFPVMKHLGSFPSLSLSKYCWIFHAAGVSFGKMGGFELGVKLFLQPTLLCPYPFIDTDWGTGAGAAGDLTLRSIWELNQAVYPWHTLEAPATSIPSSTRCTTMPCWWASMALYLSTEENKRL